MKNITPLLLLCSLLVHVAFGQTKSFDERYIEASISLVSTDLKHAQSVGDSLLQEAESDDQRIKAHMLLANIYKNFGDRAGSIHQGELADQIAKASLNPYWQAYTAGFLASSFRQAGLYSIARTYINHADQACERFKNQKNYLQTKVNILFERVEQETAQANHQAAMDYALLAEQLVKEGDSTDARTRLLQATSQQMIANCALSLGEIGWAKRANLLALKRIGEEETFLKGYIYWGLAEVAMAEDSLALARSYLDLADTLAKSSGDLGLSISVGQTWESYYWNAGDVERSRAFAHRVRDLRKEEFRGSSQIAETLLTGIITERDNYINRFKGIVILSVCLGVLVVFLLIYLFLLRRSFRRGCSFSNQKEPIAVPVEEPKQEERIEVRTAVNISKETQERILKGLEEFERDLMFLEKDISLNGMAKLLHTNQRYMSYCIREFRGKDFYGYIQTARIDYIVKKIKAEPKLLEYKLAHLAELSGFTSASQFSIAFKAEMGFPPSTYIHLLKNQTGEQP